MKKAARIIGIISVGFVLLGTIFRFLHFPGGGLLIVLFSGTFAGFALPLNLLALRHEKKSRTRRIAEVLGTLFAMHAVVLMLFLAQNWPGWNNILIQGAILFIAFIVFLILSSRNTAEPLKPVTNFNIMFIAMMALLSLSQLNTINRKEERDRLVQLNTMQVEHCDSLRKVVEVVYHDYIDRAAVEDDSLYHQAQALYRDGRQVIDFIDRLQEDLVTEINYGLNTSAWDTTMQLQDPMNVDVPTHYFIGADAQNITGKAPELYDVLSNYRNRALHPDVPFFIGQESTMEEKTQWAKDNFYKATAIEIMTRLTLLKENVYQSMIYAIDYDLYVK